MISAFFQILEQTFLAFFLVPFSSGSIYKVGVMFFGPFLPFVAKIFGILLALLINYFIGFSFGKIVKKDFSAPSPWIFLLSVLTFIPVISGFIAFYFGALKLNFCKFIFFSFFASVVYYLIAIFFPVLNIYF